MTAWRIGCLSIVLVVTVAPSLSQPETEEGEVQSPQAYELVEDDTPEAEAGQPQAPVVREFKPTEEVMADTILSLPADI